MKRVKDKTGKEIIMRLPKSLNGLRDLCDYIKSQTGNKKVKVLEVGCFTGDSTVIFAEYFNEVISVDPWQSNIGDITNTVDMDQAYEVAKENTKEFDNVKLVKGYSYDIKKEVGRKKFDVIYIDGSHTYEDTKRDIDLFWPNVKKGGFLAGHDYAQKFPGVIRAVKEFLRENNLKAEPDKKFKDWSWIVRK